MAGFFEFLEEVRQASGDAWDNIQDVSEYLSEGRSINVFELIIGELRLVSEKIRKAGHESSVRESFRSNQPEPFVSLTMFVKNAKFESEMEFRSKGTSLEIVAFVNGAKRSFSETETLPIDHVSIAAVTRRSANFVRTVLAEN